MGGRLVEKPWTRFATPTQLIRLNIDQDPIRLLLVEDDIQLAAMVSDFLSEHGYLVQTESDGLRAVQRIENESYGVILLDIGLPGMDGISICRRVRSQFAGLILMLTARGDEVDEVVSIELGADDYMAKPVRPRVLLARLNMHLRRSNSEPTSSKSQLEVNGLRIIRSSRQVFLEGQLVELTTAEFELLWLLAKHAGQDVKRQDIYEELLGLSYDGKDRSIDLRISRLRKKLGDDPNHPTRIKSVRGVGYILATES